MKGSVLVVGSGISGMRAAAELVQHGIKVHLLDERPTIGGTMAQLDKMYPTNECATCTQLPKMLELTSNQNVNIIAFAELMGLEQTDGGFSVRIEKKVRYVDPLKCNACTECFPVCPVGGVPMDFDLGRGKSKAIRFWSPFPPRKALIDPEACTYIKQGVCGEGSEPLCQKACEPGAIDFSQKPAEVRLEVGAVVVATGAEEQRGELAERLGHGKLDNVLTSLEYERLLSGLGPTAGVVKRDDGSAPRRMAWIVCEDFDEQARAASPLCFMAASSEALGTLERDAEAEVTVISGGPKTEGKGYEAFRADAEQRGVHFLNASSVTVSQGEGGGVMISCSAGGGQDSELEADMLVLSCPLTPPAGFDKLAERLGIELDERGHPRKLQGDLHPLHTTREGILVCGTAEGPKGIRESVIQACAAAAGVTARLADVRGTDVTPPPAAKLHEVSPADEPKIAVVICRCGANIAGALDVGELRDYVASLPGVARAEVTPFGCDGVMIKELISTGEYNRLVLGACSPRTHESLFQQYIEAGGLNRYLLEIVNLRNHCAWVHAKDREGLARKARTLMRMGVARVALSEPLEPIRFPVTQSCLVVGGSPAGLACAARLGEMGFETHLVIAEAEPDAALEAEAKAVTEPALRSLGRNGKVTIYPQARVGRLEGYVGNYKAEVLTPEGPIELLAGALVVGTGEKMGQTGEQGDFEQALYLTRDDDSFFVGALGNLNPLDFNTDGVFMCGSAREDYSAAWSLVSGEAAASRVATVIAQSQAEKDPLVSQIIDENCDGCAYCIEPCPAHAITLIEYMKKGDIKKTVQVNEALCKGCGSCMATCPKQGAYVRNFKPGQFAAMVRAVLEVA